MYRCRVMPPNKESVDFGPVTELGRKLASNYIAESPHQAAVNALKRTVRILGGRYFTLAKELSVTFKDEGLQILRNGLRAWAHHRGHLLREQHENLSHQPSPSALFNDFDLPYQFLWDAHEEISHRAYRLQIEHCPLAEVWSELEGLEMGQIYCKETYPAIVESYGLELNFRLAQCLCRGEDMCVFELS